MKSDVSLQLLGADGGVVWMLDRGEVPGPPGLIAVPCMEMMHTRAALALYALERPSGTLLNMSWTCRFIAAKRNAACDLALQIGVPWVLFVDDDMQPHPRALARLLSHGVDIVGAAYPQRYPPFGPNLALLSGQGIEPDPAAPLVEVAAIGAGMLLIRRQVLEAFGPPWFSANADGVGEDYAFCHAARSAGFKIHVDACLQVPHLSTVGVTFHEANQLQHLRPPEQPDFPNASLRSIPKTLSKEAA
jgi:hypothetical protein